MPSYEQLVEAAECLNVQDLTFLEGVTSQSAGLLEAIALIYGAAESYSVQYATEARLQERTNDPVEVIDDVTTRARHNVGPVDFTDTMWAIWNITRISRRLANPSSGESHRLRPASVELLHILHATLSAEEYDGKGQSHLSDQCIEEAIHGLNDVEIELNYQQGQG